MKNTTLVWYAHEKISFLSKDSGKIVYMLATAFVGTLILTASAKVSIPFYPVPMTLQTLVVLALSMMMGAKLAGLTMAMYLLEGALGLPVFAGTPAKGIGLAYMFGPTGGYLLGFFVAGVLCGYLAEKGWDRKLWSAFLVMIFGNIVIYSFGVTWLGTLLGWDKPILEWGLLPFIYGDLLKIALGGLLMPIVWKFVAPSSEK